MIREPGCRCYQEAGDSECPVHPRSAEDLAYAAAGDTAGIVALRNAAPQLLALWEACEAERNAVCTTNVERWDEAEKDDTRCFSRIHADACPVAVARTAVAAVLAKGLS